MRETRLDEDHQLNRTALTYDAFPKKIETSARLGKWLALFLASLNFLPPSQTAAQDTHFENNRACGTGASGVPNIFLSVNGKQYYNPNPTIETWLAALNNFNADASDSTTTIEFSEVRWPLKAPYRLFRKGRTLNSKISVRLPWSMVSYFKRHRKDPNFRQIPQMEIQGAITQCLERTDPKLPVIIVNHSDGANWALEVINGDKGTGLPPLTIPTDKKLVVVNLAPAINGVLGGIIKPSHSPDEIRQMVNAVFWTIFIRIKDDPLSGMPPIDCEEENLNCQTWELKPGIVDLIPGVGHAHVESRKDVMDILHTFFTRILLDTQTTHSAE